MLEKLLAVAKKRKIYLLVALIIIIAVSMAGSDETEKETKRVLRPVALTSLLDLQGKSDLNWLGNVRAVSDITLLSEADGVVTSVPTTLGQKVSAGQVIAVLENSRERAALLQAEGAYEAALATEKQGGVSLEEAKRDLEKAKASARIAHESVRTTITNTLSTYLDQFYANENSSQASLRITTPLPTATVNAERVYFGQLISSWTSLSETADVAAIDKTLEEAKTELERLVSLVDTFHEAVAMPRNNYVDSEVVAIQSNLSTGRATLLAAIATLNDERQTLSASRDDLARANISSGSTGDTLTDAQVKQALGSLRQAQSALAKTIIRTPISGTINSLTPKVGTRLNNLAEVARIASNDSLEVVIYLSEDDRNHLTEGQLVMIDGSVEGKVAIITEAINTSTGKVEARIELPKEASLTNGKSVKVTPITKTDTPIRKEVPLSSVRFNNEQAFILKVENGKVIEKLVTVGEPFGGKIVITSDLEDGEEFIEDARGIAIGEEVEVK